MARTTFSGPVASQNGFLGSMNSDNTQASDNLGISSFVSGTNQNGKTIRLNSVTNTGTANSTIGFQSKITQGASQTSDVIGCEIGPRLNNGVALTGTGTVIGTQVDVYLRGTTGNVAGSVRGMQIELVTDAGSTRTIAGEMVGIRFRNNTSCTVTGDMSVLRIEDDESTNVWDFFAKIDANMSIASATGTATTQAGWIKVKVGSSTKYIALYDTV